MHLSHLLSIYSFSRTPRKAPQTRLQTNILRRQTRAMENPVPTPARRRTRTATATFVLALVYLLVEGVMAPLSGGGGEWQLLHASIGISAMHMQLLPGDKVVMFDRTDFGPSNISLPNGHCRSDPADLALTIDCTAHSVLLDLPSTALRPLTLLSDTWCSSAALLSNGSLFQSGGFNDGDRSVRLFDSVSGDVNADWLEFPSYLAVRRWYASNQLLPDGRVLILGGRRQFSYEFFPRQESGAGGKGAFFHFPFLEETRDGDAENNLYPFLHLLPDGNLFVFANTRAVVLDVVGHQVLRRLPSIPDDVPRNYPSSGSSVLLPLRPPPGGAAFPRPEVLICGGAPRGSYQTALRGVFLPAATTCGRIGPADPTPVWSIETMPMPRVMGDMVLLPTGDVLIVNGAGAGTAGWELAREPVTNPVLYCPRSQAGLRFTVLNPSNIPRLYHSTAVLDSYGRVLVGGSNPHVGYNFTNVTYPTELSLEAFNPPYLAAARPRVVALGAPAAEVGYREVVVVRFEVAAPVAGAVEVVAVAPAFATHALGMNQRAVVLPLGRVTQVGPFQYEAEAVAPSSPEVAPPGYYLWFVVQSGVPSQGVWVRIRPAL